MRAELSRPNVECQLPIVQGRRDLGRLNSYSYKESWAQVNGNDSPGDLTTRPPTLSSEWRHSWYYTVSPAPVPVE